MRIHFLSARTYRAHCFTYPTRVFARQLRDEGLETRIFFRADDPRLTRCDVLAVVADYWDTRTLYRHGERAVELLERLRPRVPALAWCDVTDDNGHLFEPAFAHVDLYLKNQVLRDRELYREPFRERGYHNEYYYRNHPQELARYAVDRELPTQRALESWEIEKIAISWNVGLGDYNTFFGRARRLRVYWPFARHARPHEDARNAHRPVAVTCRGKQSYSLPAVSLHRTETLRLVRDLGEKAGVAVGCEGFLGRRDYLREIARSELCVSPFGFGEICWRDFECFLCGALLVKPDMDHLETWPDYYEKGITYAAYRWDFSDLQSRLLELLKDPASCREIACRGQERFLESLSPAGGFRFASHLATQMRRALERASAAA